MPLTFIEIERRKTWRISTLFVFLIVLYFLMSFAIVQGFLLIVPLPVSSFGFLLSSLSPLSLSVIVIFSLLMAGLHFWMSASNAVRSAVRTLGAMEPDPEDGIHRRLINICQELSVFTGGRRKIRCLVVPTLSMNALAITDLKGDAVIAVSEGLLSRLNRSQLEAVVAHEAYHILSGDCLENSVAASLFGLHASFLEKMESLGDERYPGPHPAFLLFSVLLKLSALLNMFISREREYRADAASLRMTRNPLSMAEALHILSRNWTGTGLISSGLEMLCIVSPRTSELDESEGWWPDLFSTHPPMRKRISALLKLAKVSLSEFERTMEAKTVTPSDSQGEVGRFYVLDPRRQWQGPFGLVELAALPWLAPLTWMAGGNGRAVERVSENGQVSAVLRERHASREEGSHFSCPVCRVPLSLLPYEKTMVHRCRSCGGTLVENEKIPRIIARTEVECTDRVKALARATLRDHQRRLAVRRLRETEPVKRNLLGCGKCGHPMMRTFYSLAYLIEIDRCGLCGVTWFDQDELEMLQCIIENRITAGTESL